MPFKSLAKNTCFHGFIIIIIFSIGTSFSYCRTLLPNQSTSQPTILSDTTPKKIFPLELNGKVMERKNNMGIPFTTIVVCKNWSACKGAVTDIDGIFKLKIDESDLQENYLCLRISNVGYQEKHLDLVMNNCFANKPLSILLEENPPSDSNGLVYITTWPKLNEAEVRAKLISDSLKNVDAHKYLLLAEPCK